MPRSSHQRKLIGLNHWSSVRSDVLRERFVGNRRSSRRPSGNSTVLKIDECWLPCLTLFIIEFRRLTPDHCETPPRRPAIAGLIFCSPFFVTNDDATGDASRHNNEGHRSRQVRIHRSNRGRNRHSTPVHNLHSSHSPGRSWDDFRLRNTACGNFFLFGGDALDLLLGAMLRTRTIGSGYLLAHFGKASVPPSARP